MNKDWTNVLKSLKTNSGVTVFELTQTHRVSLTFIKWLGCPMCVHDIEIVAKFLPTFLKLNTIPIICVQEDLPTAQTYFDSIFKHNPMAKQLLFVPGITKDIQHEFGLKSLPIVNHFRALPKMIPLLLEGLKFEWPKHSVADALVEFGLFLFDVGGTLIHQWGFKKLGDRPDYGQYLVDMKKDYQSNMDQVEKLIAMFPEVAKMAQQEKSNKHISGVPHYDDLEEVMKDKKKRVIFKMYTVNEHSVENILFVEQVEQYKLASDKVRASMAEKIIKTFLKDDSFMEINVSLKVKQKLLNQLLEHGESCDLFDFIVNEVYSTVLMDTFSRFKLSPMYLHMYE